MDIVHNKRYVQYSYTNGAVAFLLSGSKRDYVHNFGILYIIHKVIPA